MKTFLSLSRTAQYYFFGLLLLGLCSHQSCLAQNVRATVTVKNIPTGPNLEQHFLGLSYEISELLPRDDRYYFNTNDQALVNIFKTLGIRNLRVGADAVDDPKIAVPQEKDIDNFFNFAQAVDASVIYSFRLKNGDTNEAARLACYISAHHGENLDCFSIGNEPNFYFRNFDDYFTAWKQQYDAILSAVPSAIFIGPSVANDPPAKQNYYPLELAKSMGIDDHLKIASDHYYFLGRRNDLEKDPAATRVMLLSDKVHLTYEEAYGRIGAKLAARGIPYRIDELNNCARGGAKDSSDTYAAALWALDCTHWWAAHHIMGMNYHTGEFKKSNGTFGAPYYSAFVHRADGKGLDIRPQAYAYLAFTEAAHGQSLPVKIYTTPDYDFDAYAFRDDDGTIYITLINKSYGAEAKTASVTINLPEQTRTGQWQRMDLKQKENDPSAKSDIAFGKSPINSQGEWFGQWTVISNVHSKKLTVETESASAIVLRFSGSGSIAKRN